MCKNYMEPEMDMIRFDVEDVITTSGDSSCNNELPQIPE